jgi:hypothetical protein
MFAKRLLILKVSDGGLRNDIVRTKKQNSHTAALFFIAPLTHIVKVYAQFFWRPHALLTKRVRHNTPYYALSKNFLGNSFRVELELLTKSHD